MLRELFRVASLLPVLMLLWPVPSSAESPSIVVLQDRVYRAGVYLAIDALVRNELPWRVEAIEASIEFYNHFDELVSVEQTLVNPASLGPGHVGALRVVALYSDAVRKIHYRFTWRQGDEQIQAVEARYVWTFGSPTREMSPRPPP